MPFEHDAAGPARTAAEREGDWAEALKALQTALFEYPLAAQAAFAALVAEGKAFAATEDGAVWHDRLAGSALIGKGRVVWEVLTQSAFTDDRQTVLPSVVLDAFSRSTAIALLEPFLSLLFEERA